MHGEREAVADAVPQPANVQPASDWKAGELQVMAGG